MARERLGVEDRREGFPAISEWRLPVVPSPIEHDKGTTGKPPVNTEDSALPCPSRALFQNGAQLGDSAAENAVPNRSGKDESPPHVECIAPERHQRHHVPHAVTGGLICRACH